MRNQRFNVPGLLTRNNSIDCHEYKTGSNLQKKQIFDAVAAASIVNNCSGVDTSKSQVITLATFTKFLESRQQEKLNDEEIKALIKVNIDQVRSPARKNVCPMASFLSGNFFLRIYMKLISSNILHARHRRTQLTCLRSISNKLLLLKTINDPSFHSVIRNHDSNLPHLKIEDPTSLRAHATAVALLYLRSYNAT